jgi:hypothetical protein
LLQGSFEQRFRVAQSRLGSSAACAIQHVKRPL